MTRQARSPERDVGSRGGVVRQSVLRQAGWSKYEIARSVSAGALMRLRRSWLAVPDADRHLCAAARAGVVLTCVTEADRRGLWVLAIDRPHVAAAAHTGGVQVKRLPRGTATDVDTGFCAAVHWSKPLVSRDPTALVDPLENVLALVAVCQPFEAALAVWESALRQGLVDSRAMARLPLSTRARDVLEQASPFSDSGLESFVVPRLRWLGLRIVPQAWVAGHHVDFLIGERLVLQLDGGHHIGLQRAEDNTHDARLKLQGYHVIRVGYHQVITDWPGVQHLVMISVAQGLHRAA